MHFENMHIQFEIHFSTCSYILLVSIIILSVAPFLFYMSLHAIISDKMINEGSGNLILPHVASLHTIRLSCAILVHYVGSVVAAQS
jgi:hypothetical protein